MEFFLDKHVSPENIFRWFSFINHRGCILENIQDVLYSLSNILRIGVGLVQNTLAINALLELLFPVYALFRRLRETIRALISLEVIELLLKKKLPPDMLVRGPVYEVVENRASLGEACDVAGI